MSNAIKVGFCVAYDWEYLRISLPLVYNEADKICLAIDKERISWAGNAFGFDTARFLEFVKDVDKDGKIDVYEDDFHLTGLRPMENEVRQRNLMASRMGSGGWHIQLDTDEYFIDFPGFVAYLRGFVTSRPINVVCPWHVMFKRTDNGFLFVRTKEIEYIAIATRHPRYEYGRRNRNFDIKTNFTILHQSWARPNDEIQQKINNWGHKEDFDISEYYNGWAGLNERNYTRFTNFHPTQPKLWESLELVREKDVLRLVEHFKHHLPNQVSQSQLKKENSIWRSRLRALLKKIPF